jgi:hypothetical protein
MTIVIAISIALPLAAVLLVVSALFHRISLKRIDHEMASFPCPYCAHPFGVKAISNGQDCSPFEELWPLQGKLVHCHPVLGSVKCEHCGSCCVIRLNRDGGQFGPRLSVDDAEQIARIKAMSPELLGEMKAWLAEKRRSL